MNSKLKSALALTALALASQAMAQVTFYESDGFNGRSFTTQQPIGDFSRFGFNDRASSAVVSGSRWEVCDDVAFSGRCFILRQGRYPSLSSMGLNDRVSSVRPVNNSAVIQTYRYAPAPPPPVAPQITFFQGDGFSGQSFTSRQRVDNLARYGFNDRASSAIVVGDRWEVCQDAGFNGRCVVLRQGRYASLSAMGLNDRISSVRAVGREVQIDPGRYAPVAVVSPADFRRHDNEQLFQANVTSVHAVVGPPEKRCWVEHQEVANDRGNANVGGALAGALLGGILGHQVGGGSGRDLATAGGAVAGGLIGANVGRDGNGGSHTQDVQRCNTVPSQARPEFWDVTYNFRGVEHRMQMTSEPGPTVSVNRNGEPRS